MQIAAAAALLYSSCLCCPATNNNVDDDGLLLELLVGRYRLMCVIPCTCLIRRRVAALLKLEFLALFTVALLLLALQAQNQNPTKPRTNPRRSEAITEFTHALAAALLADS